MFNMELAIITGYKCPHCDKHVCMKLNKIRIDDIRVALDVKCPKCLHIFWIEYTEREVFYKD